ncbi:MAG: hypothetical protein JST68_30150 [Bacteroidetes bacterium]|nr:hypothetical protein [Bacteroidota bacterium]
MPQENADITLFDVKRYAREVQTIMSTPPVWIVRWGTLSLFLLMAVTLFISWFIRYPDIVRGNFVLTSSQPAVKMVSMATGRLKLLVGDKDSVRRGQVMGFIENTADFSAILTYMSLRDTFSSKILRGDFAAIPNTGDLGLGELHDTYISFQNNVNDYKHYVRENNLNKNLDNLSGQQKIYGVIDERIRSQAELYEQQRKIGELRLGRDSFLFKEKVLSQQDLENSRNSYIPMQAAISTMDENKKMNELRFLELDSRRADLRLSESRYANDLKNRILSSFIEMEKRFLLWEQQYLFVSPISGRVTLFELRSDNQFVKSAQEVMNVSPTGDQSLMGYVMLPIQGSGKVKAGQRVTIDMTNFPSEEYGFIRGEVQSISTLPKDGMYYVSIRLVRGLISDMGKEIPYKEQSIGTAAIVTEDMRLSERFMYKFTKLLKRNE